MSPAQKQARRDQAEAVISQIEAEQARHAEYRAYLCMMTDHGCDCVALPFEAWEQVPR
jgi:hypothetical protein